MISIKSGIYLLLLFLYVCFVIRKVCRFWYGGKLKEEIERLSAENKRLKTDLENEKDEVEALNNALQTAGEAGKKDEPIAETFTNSSEKRKSFFSSYPPPGGVSFEEINSMVRVMHGKPVSGEVQAEAVMGVWKTEDTHLFDELLERINGALPEVEKTLNAFKKKRFPKKDDSGFKDFDILEFLEINES